MINSVVEAQVRLKSVVESLCYPQRPGMSALKQRREKESRSGILYRQDATGAFQRCIAVRERVCRAVVRLCALRGLNSYNRDPLLPLLLRTHRLMLCLYTCSAFACSIAFFITDT